jgi:hypothetical protein
MRVAIMQPYFLPYIGYFQLIGAVDLYVLYDNIKYTKRGWINRNRILGPGGEATITLPLKHAPDTLDICERQIAADFARGKLLNRISETYRRAPHYGEVFPLIAGIVENGEPNLFRYLRDSIVKICRQLGIDTRIVASSEIPADHTLRHEARVLSICKAVGATTYVNAIGGVDLYSKSDFADAGLDLRFIRSRPFEYGQGGRKFVAWLSIVDVMMFNSAERIRDILASGYELIESTL